MNGEKLSKMIVLATNAHDGQFDKGGTPYILHPMKVMHYLKTDDIELQMIALGHDLLEDTSVTVEQFQSLGFSERVISGIVALTKVKGKSYDQYKEQVMANVDAMRVKLADLRHNTDIRRLKGISEKDMRRMEKYNIFYTQIKEKLESMK